MTDLVTWLRAQLDEDERVALEVIGNLGDPDARPVSLSGTGQLIVGDRAIPATTTSHMLRWSPNRVLAEVEAKRRILDLAESAADRAAMKPGYDTVARLEHSLAKVTAPEFERVLRLIALPYADSPGYREEWRP